MTSSDFGTVLRRWLQSLDGSAKSEASDGQLLDRFIQQRDEAAFAALEVTDSLAPWLHAVATRIARKARVMALRRRCRETQAEMPTANDQFAEMERRDLPAPLDEELLVDAEFLRMQAPFGDTVRPSPRASLV